MFVQIGMFFFIIIISYVPVFLFYCTYNTEVFPVVCVRPGSGGEGAIAADSTGSTTAAAVLLPGPPRSLVETRPAAPPFPPCLHP